MFLRTSLLLAAIGVVLAGCSPSHQEPGAGHDHPAHAMEGHHGDGSGGAMAQSGEMNAQCPVTGEDVDPSIFVEYGGKKVYFCCDSCKADFNQDPDHYFAEAYPSTTGR